MRSHPTPSRGRRRHRPSQFADSALIVSWQPPANEGSAITGYELEMGGAGSGKVSVGSTSYTWPGLTNGANYQFRRRGGQRRRSVGGLGVVGRRAPARPSPGHPSQPRPDPGRHPDRSVVGGGETNGDPITRYEIRREGSGEIRTHDGHRASRGGTCPTASPSSSGCGPSTATPIPARGRAASAPMKPCGVPDTIQGVTAVRGDQQARVTWPAPNEQGCAISDYTVIASNGMRQSTTVDVASTSVRSPTAQPVTFRVYATNSVGDGRASSRVQPGHPRRSADRPDPGGRRTDAASGRSPSPGTRRTTTAPPLTDYQVIINDGPPQSAGADDTSYVHSGLGPGQTYTYKVIACNDVGCGAQSGACHGHHVDRPGGAGGPGPVATTTAPSRRLDGAAPTAARRSPATTCGSPLVARQPTSRHLVFVVGLTYGQTYSVDVQACNAVGCGAWSPASSLTIHGTPAQVATPAVSVTDRQHRQRLVEPAQHERLHALPLQRRASSHGSTAATAATGSRSRSPDRDYDTTYDVRVQACSTDRGCGPWSNWNSARTGDRRHHRSRSWSAGERRADRPPATGRARHPGSCGSTCWHLPHRRHRLQPPTPPTPTGATTTAADSGGGNTRTTNGNGEYHGDLGCYNGYPRRPLGRPTAVSDPTPTSGSTAPRTPQPKTETMTNTTHHLRSTSPTSTPSGSATGSTPCSTTSSWSSRASAIRSPRRSSACSPKGTC